MQDSLRRNLFMHHYPYCRIVAHGALTQIWELHARGTGQSGEPGGNAFRGRRAQSSIRLPLPMFSITG